MNNSNLSDLVTVMFDMGRFMRDHMQKKMGASRCPSLLHLETLRYVQEYGQPLMHDVARRFRITPPAATILIEGLVKEKQLKRIVDTRDRRAVRLAVTAAGKKVLARGIVERVNELKKIFSVLTPAERMELSGILKKILKENRGAA